MPNIPSTQVEDVTLPCIEQHLPFLGPLHQLVNDALELPPLLIILHNPTHLGVVSKLQEDGAGHLHSPVDIVDKDEEQGGAQD